MTSFASWAGSRGRLGRLGIGLLFAIGAIDDCFLRRSAFPNQFEAFGHAIHFIVASVEHGVLSLGNASFAFPTAVGALKGECVSIAACHFVTMAPPTAASTRANFKRTHYQHRMSAWAALPCLAI